MYPKDLETREKVAYPTMRNTLSISCPLLPSFQTRRMISNTFLNSEKNEKNEKNGNNNSTNINGNNSNNGNGNNGNQNGSGTGTGNSDSRKFSRTDSQFANMERNETKVPVSLMLSILKDIFSKLISEHPIVLIIEEAHEMDEFSWKLLLSLMKMQMKSFILLTQEPVQYLINLYTAAGSESPIGKENLFVFILKIHIYN